MKACVVNPGHCLDHRSFRKQGADIYRCRDCGCIMADIEFVHQQYESGSYYTLAQKTIDSIDGEWGFRWRYILNQLVRRGQVASLLDVGAGNGYFISVASREFGLRATGLEISAAEIAFAHDVIGVQLISEDVGVHAAKYDAVTCFNVLEHVSDPQGFLSAVLERVEAGGLLVLTTPNPACVHARVKGLKSWNMVDPPHHINLFSRKSLYQMLKDRKMEILRYETLSTYINFVRKFDTNSLLLRRLFFHALRIANLGADHFVIARKAAANTQASI
jgi:2-polyprenyl-3-methyl-5-hydroxy-6-metoxy-1,4-benzoquinol methylase